MNITLTNWSNAVIMYDSILGWLLTFRGGNLELVITQEKAFRYIKLLKELNKPNLPLP